MKWYPRSVPDDQPVCFEGEEEAARAFARVLPLAYRKGSLDRLCDSMVESLRVLRIDASEFFRDIPPPSAVGGQP